MALLYNPEDNSAQCLGNFDTLIQAFGESVGCIWNLVVHFMGYDLQSSWWKWLHFMDVWWAFLLFNTYLYLNMEDGLLPHMLCTTTRIAHSTSILYMNAWHCWWVGEQTHLVVPRKITQHVHVRKCRTSCVMMCTTFSSCDRVLYIHTCRLCRYD